MTRFFSHLLVYLVVGIVALCLTLATADIERNGRLEGGYPFVSLVNSNNPTGSGSLTLFDDPLTLGFYANLVIYGVFLLTFVRVSQSVFAQPPQMKRSLYFLIPASGFAMVCFIVGSMGYNPFPTPAGAGNLVRRPTPTPEPAYVMALRQRWVATDETTGQPLELQFFGYEMSLRIADVEYTGNYTWISPERILLSLGRYIEVEADTTSRPCPRLPTVFNAPCQQAPGRGYPVPIRITPILRDPAGSYPGPNPESTVVEPYGLYQGIEAEYQVMVTRTDLTLIAPTGEVQEFTAALPE
jgi:hypothetical protein